MRDKEASMPNEAPVIRTIAMPADTNPAGDIFGGWLMSQMDLAAASIASLVSRGRAATIKADAMVFHSPVFVGDEVSPNELARQTLAAGVHGSKRWKRWRSVGQ